MTHPPQVLAFDVFGTVVDWFSTITREVNALQRGVDGGEFALAWRAGYRPAMQKVMAGELPWTRIDELHRMILDELLVRFRLNDLSEDERRHLNRVWHRLDPWPDSVAGLTRLKSRFMICSLSNGNLG
ncbi:MAG TPA: haloacid dehalogenase type II, partial [Burkholderiaceae bacterium]|nr:haloacid dehalogenase type II [Burkholderiaceae bacterium]